MHLSNPPVGGTADCRRLGNLAAAKEAMGADAAFAESERRRLEEVATAGKDFAYRYTYAPNELRPNQGSSLRLYGHYEMRADPVKRGTTGFSSFWMSDTATFRHNDREPAGANDPAWDDEP